MLSSAVETSGVTRLSAVTLASRSAQHGGRDERITDGETRGSRAPVTFCTGFPQNAKPKLVRR